MGGLVGRVEFGVAAVVQALEVQVLVVGQLRVQAHHRGDPHVRAHRRDAAKLHAEVGIAAVGDDAALAETQAAQVVAPEGGGQLAHELHQRLDPAGGVLVAAAEGRHGELQDLAQRALDHAELRHGGRRKARAALRHAVRDIRDADGVVAQTLKLGCDLVILVENGDVLLQPQMRQQLDHVAAAAVGEVVDVLLLREQLPVEGFVVMLQQEEGLFDVFAGGAEHGQQHLIAAVEGERRRVDEAGVQAVQLLAVFLLDGGRGLVLHDAAAELFVDVQHREETDRAAEVEDGVGVGDHAGVDGAVPQAVQQAEAVRDGDAEEHQHGLAEVEEDVHDADAPRLRLCADGDHDGGRDAVAEVDADDDGVDGLEAQHAGGGEGLQDADRDRGALQHEGHARAGQVAEDRVVAEAGEELFDRAAGLREIVHRAGHVHQSGEQDAEADGDAAEGLAVFHEMAHDQEHPEDEREGRQRGGLEEAQPGCAGGVDVQQADDLAGDRRADVRADDDAQRLVQGQDARADEAGGDDDHGGGGLDERGDADAEQEGLEGVVRHLFHGELQRAGGVLLQRVSHQAHAVQKHGKPAEQGDAVKNVHINPSVFLNQNSL